MMETTISFSFRRLAFAQLTASCISVVGWLAYTMIGGFDSQIVLVGVGEPIVLLVTSFVFLALFSPSKQRPVATASTLWSANSFVRFAAALGASCLLYYAAQFGARPMMFSFLLTAVLLLFCETKVIARSLAELSTSTEE